MDRIYFGWRDQWRKRVKRSAVLCKILGKGSDHSLHFDNFEYPPMPIPEGSVPQILLLTRLWGPLGDEVAAGPAVRERTQRELDVINGTRIECIEACRAAFTGHFVGGLSDSPYARRVAPHLIAPTAITNKQSFMALVKASPICIATTGLILSTGWRFGEYIAASRAIVTEKVHDTFPGSFRAPENYLEFSTVDQLLSVVRGLLADRTGLNAMMWNNYCYYRNHGRPDSLILNALLTAMSGGTSARTPA
jgi:hypothetical protein